MLRSPFLSYGKVRVCVCTCVYVHVCVRLYASDSVHVWSIYHCLFINLLQRFSLYFYHFIKRKQECSRSNDICILINIDALTFYTSWKTYSTNFSECQKGFRIEYYWRIISFIHVRLLLRINIQAANGYFIYYSVNYDICLYGNVSVISRLNRLILFVNFFPQCIPAFTVVANNNWLYSAINPILIIL